MGLEEFRKNVLSTYIGKQQLPRYKGIEHQRSCLLVGESRLNKGLKERITEVLKSKGYQVKTKSKMPNVLPLQGDYHSEISQTNLAIAILTAKSNINSYILGILQSSLVPTIMLSIGDYPTVRNVPKEYQRRIISNKDHDNDVEIIDRQISLFEEDFIEIDSSGKAKKYADKLASSPLPGQYTHDFRTNIIQEVTMGDTFKNIQDATVINKSTLKNSFNREGMTSDQLDTLKSLVNSLKQELLKLDLSNIGWNRFCKRANQHRE